MGEFIQRISAPTFIQVIIEIWNSIFLLIMILSLALSVRQSKISFHSDDYKTPFTREILLFFIAVFLYNAFDIAIGLIMGVPGDLYVVLNYALDIGYFAVGAFQTLLFLQVIKKYVAESNGRAVLKKVAFIMQLLHIPALVLLAVTPFTHWLFYIDEQNNYHRAALYPVWYFTTIAVFLFIFAVLIIYRKKMDSFIFKVLLTSSVLPIIAFIANYSYSGISFNNIAVSVSALIIYVFYENHRTAAAVHRERELNRVQNELLESKLTVEQANNEMLLAQIQPHFISNSLMALRSQCREYPEVYESLTNFSLYLRSHFEALGSTNKMISFEQEMENTEAYLELEQQNFGDRLRVDYNIECDDFMLPPLSVQPLVENAVRHGVGTYDKGGVVSISSRREQGKIIIEITDDGSGSSNITPQQSKRRGIGIDNVRARLKSIVGGELEVLKNERGTTARITLPDVTGGKVC
ncbi:MAG: histidine kinase [Ruminococcus sp.]|nr:histidine kinase [Ruminococcus sp.]